MLRNREKATRELLGGIAYLVFTVLSLSGAALAVAALFALLDRVPAASPDVRAGQCRQLRLYGICWARLVCAWLIGIALLTLP